MTVNVSQEEKPHFYTSVIEKLLFLVYYTYLAFALHHKNKPIKNHYEVWKKQNKTKICIFNMWTRMETVSIMMHVTPFPISYM